MRITKIYWKRFSRPVALITGLFLGVLFTSGYLLHDLVQQKKAYAAEQNKQVQQSTSPLSGSRITGYSKLGDWENYRVLTSDLQQLTSDDIKARGYRLQPVAACHLIITKGPFREDLRC